MNSVLILTKMNDLWAFFSHCPWPQGALLAPQVIQEEVQCTKIPTCQKAGPGKSVKDKGVRLQGSGMFILLGIFFLKAKKESSGFENSILLSSPEGRKFRSRNELRQYLDKHNLDHNAEDFDFSIWGRGNRPPSKSSSSNSANSAAASNSGPATSGSSSATQPASSSDGLQTFKTFNS